MNSEDIRVLASIAGVEVAGLSDALKRAAKFRAEGYASVSAEAEQVLLADALLQIQAKLQQEVIPDLVETKEAAELAAEWSKTVLARLRPRTDSHGE